MPEQKYAEAIAGSVPVDAESHEIRYFCKEKGSRVFMHPSSVNFHATEYGSVNSFFLICQNRIKDNNSSHLLLFFSVHTLLSMKL